MARRTQHVKTLRVDPPPLLQEPVGPCALGARHDVERKYDEFPAREADVCAHCGLAIAPDLPEDDDPSPVSLTALMCPSCARDAERLHSCARCWGALDPETGQCWQGNKHGS